MIAGAVAAGLMAQPGQVLAAIATLVAIVLGFAVVYAGVAYPGDALAGLLLGALVSLALYPLAIGSLRDLAHGSRVRRSSSSSAGRRGASVGPGPAARPELVGESGAVRILSPDEVGQRRPAEPEKAGPVRIVPPTDDGRELTFCIPTTPGESESFPQVRRGLAPERARLRAESGLVTGRPRCQARDNAGVAQLEAQATCNRQVVGSSPTTGSKKIRGAQPRRARPSGFARRARTPWLGAGRLLGPSPRRRHH